MGYRASNNRDRDAAAEWRRMPLSERWRHIDWAIVALEFLFAAAVIVPAAVAIWHWLS
jgi:hypothetical protein